LRWVPRVLASEALASVRTALFPLARLHPLPAPGAPCGRPPILLVHGFMGHRDMLRPLARRLLREGWTDVVRLGYPSTREDLEAVVARIDAAAASLGGGAIDLVGHSLGAVAARAWIRAGGGAARVRRFVSLGGPHAGTSLYRFAPAVIRPALDPRGPWVERLSVGPEPVPTWVIRARYDHQVLPPLRASLPGARETILDGHGHNGLLWSRAAHDAVIRALTEPWP
jgi:pimeloyl-ACP methyl ester carboxylesterase